MARTRRRHSYRKSRRWNPEIAPGFAGALAKTPVRPTGYAGTAAAPLVNPRGRSTRSSRARTWNRKVRESVPWWSKGRNPRKRARHTSMHVTRSGETRFQRRRRSGWGHKARNPRKGSYYSGRTHTRRGRRNPYLGVFKKGEWDRSVHRLTEAQVRMRLSKLHRKGRLTARDHTQLRKLSLLRGEVRGSQVYKERMAAGKFRGRKNPRSGSYYRAKRHLRGLSKGRRKHVVSYALGSMNPRRSRTRRGRR